MGSSANIPVKLHNHEQRAARSSAHGCDERRPEGPGIQFLPILGPKVCLLFGLKSLDETYSGLFGAPGKGSTASRPRVRSNER